MDITQALDEANAIRRAARFPLGKHRASPRALCELGPEGVVGVLGRYAGGDWPGYEPEEVDRELGRTHFPGEWPVHAATYDIGGKKYIAFTEHSFTYGSTATEVCGEDELFEGICGEEVS